MVTLLSFLVLFLLALSARASPVSTARSRVYSHAQRSTYGVSVGGDVTRFVVKYANAQRWKPSTVVSISQAMSLLQQVSAFPSYPARPLLTSSIYRTFLLLAPSPTQLQRLRTAFIWLSTFPTPSVLTVTLPLSSGPFTAHCLLLHLFTIFAFQDSWWIIYKWFCKRSLNQWC